ncbi:hypothetical protein ACI6PS_03480 [Flavobacterium sp. PLA-1-15]|uniref:hypothetical protein n=1 Tax=Flavobacterium sp. PLA-1-15 TaxID=3380533 RepID=UPI003B78BEDB
MSHLPFYNQIPVLEKQPVAKRVVEKKQRTAKDNRRYYLHQKIKGFFEYDARKRTVQLPSGTDENDTLKELKLKHNYSIQSFIE